jgi:hypothetical protein
LDSSDAERGAFSTTDDREASMKPMKMSSANASTGSAAKLAFTLFVSALTPSVALANNVTAAASTCVAPYLDQAVPMRWHENYLMNPSSNVATWVICPMTFTADELTPVFKAMATGAIMDDASIELPSCFFTINTAGNLMQPPFITDNADVYTRSMDTEDSAPSWRAVVEVSTQDIVEAISPDPGVWAVSIFCRLPPGHSISMLRLCPPATTFASANDDPIWSNVDAQSKCPVRCVNEGGVWDGHWWTTVPNAASVCECVKGC